MANPHPKTGPGGTPGVLFNTTNSPARQRWKWELAIRFMLKNPNAKQTEVAQHIGIDAHTLSFWMKDPEWVNLHNQITTGILTAVDAELAEDVRHQHLTLKRLIPVALQNLAELALQNANPSIKLKATQEILDREGHFAKVQRMGLATHEQGGISDEKDNNIAKALIDALNTAHASKDSEGKTKPLTIEASPVTEVLQ